VTARFGWSHCRSSQYLQHTRHRIYPKPVSLAFVITFFPVQIQWTQNNCELGKHHSKRGKWCEGERGKHDGEESEHV
jgi:hypothetical protein